MNVLIACEESQRVCLAFLERGHNAFSCDIQEPSGGRHDRHILGDALAAIKGGKIVTMDGKVHDVGRWDLIIAHPPCTYLSNAGARHLYKGGQLNIERYKQGMKAKAFFMAFYNADCNHICVENPIPSKVYGLPQYTQTIQPYMFGHPYTKRTCLWLKGLPKLEPTNEVEPIATWCPSSSYSHKHGEQHKGMFTTDRARNRSKTFEGIAAAMAEQWSENINKEESMTQFEIKMYYDTPELPAEIDNFEEVKAAITEALAQYSTDAIVTADSVKDAEKTRAHLRRVKDQVETYRKDAKAAYLEKFNKLESQCKELSGMIEQPISAIDTKIKEFENAESEKKWKQLDDFFWSLNPKEFIRLEDVLNPKWKNKTATISKLRQEISEAVCKIEDDFAEIEKMYGASPLWTAISDKFKVTKDKSSTLVYAAQIERQHSEEQKRAEEIQRQREAEEAARAEAAQNAICEPEAPQAVIQPETVQTAAPAAETAAPQLIRGAFRVEGTKDQIRALAQFLKQNGIRYEVIK